MKIGNKEIGKNKPTFIIAEAGVNHNGSLSTAKKLVDAAVESGADAIKFQTFKTENLVSKKAKMCDYQISNTGKTQSQFEMLKKLELTKKHHEIIFNYARKKGIIFLSTPFDDESVEFLYELGVPAFKVGSSDTNNIPLLVKIAKKQKPIILSTGMSDLNEIIESVNAIKKYNKQIIVLHCTTDYPCKLDEVNLNAMKTIGKKCDVLIGYSDHTEGIQVSLSAVALGAKIIEKHFTLDKNMKGPDHKASLEPKEFKKLTESIRNIEISLGSEDKAISDSPKKYIGEIKKSIIAKQDIKIGQKITEDLLIIKRPSYGIEPKYLDKIIGLTAKCDINKDECIQWEYLSEVKNHICLIEN